MGEKPEIAAKSRLRPISPFSYVGQGHKKLKTKPRMDPPSQSLRRGRLRMDANRSHTEARRRKENSREKAQKAQKRIDRKTAVVR